MPDDQIQIPFSGGPNETVDDRALDPGSMVTLLNASYDAQGEYQVRLGYTALDAARTDVELLATAGGELLAASGSTLYSYSPAQAAFTALDEVAPFSFSHQPLISKTTPPSAYAFAAGNGYWCIAWYEETSVGTWAGFASIYDATTGALVSTFALVSGSTGTYTCIEAGLCGTTFVVTLASASAIWAHTWVPGSGWTGPTVVSESNYTGASPLFAAEYASGAMWLAYQKGASGGLQTLHVRLLAVPALTVTTEGNTGSTGLTGPLTQLAARVAGSHLWLASASAASATVRAIDSAALTAVAGPFTPTVASNIVPTTLANTTAVTLEALSSTTVVFCADISPGATDIADASAGSMAAITYEQFTTSGAVSNTLGGAASVALASRPFAVGGAPHAFVRSPYVPTTSPTTGAVQGTYYFVRLDVTVPRLWGSYAPSIVDQAGTTFTPPRVWNETTALMVARAGTGRQGLDLFAPYTTRSLVTLGAESHVDGLRWDGRWAVEQGLPPPYVNATGTASGTASVQYCATWGWIDAQGNLEESAPGPVVELDNLAVGHVNLAVAQLHVTSHQRPDASSDPYTASLQGPFVLIYRTPDLTNGDTTFYRVNVDPVGQAYHNLLSQATVTLADASTDAQLTDGTHPVLYTVSGELNHAQPDGPLHRCVYQDRVVAIGADRRSVWGTQTYVQGSVPAWALIAQFTVDDAGEPLTAIASLYDRVLVFTASACWVVYGDFGALSGAGSSLTPPQRITAAFGCIEPRSVVNCPLGVMYQSSRGLELLDASLNATFLGLPVSVTTATYPVCTSATFTPGTSLVRFTMQTADGTAGRLVAFDLRRQLWTVHTLWGGSAYDAPAASGTDHPIYGYVVAQDNGVARENTTADAVPWQDWGASYPELTVTTAWIKSGDLQGWQKVRRVRLLAKYYDQNALTASLDYDYQAVGETHSFAANVIANVAASGLEQVRIIPAQGRCEAMRVTVTMQAPAGNSSGRGAGLTGLAFEVHRAKGGYRPIPSSMRS